MSTAAPGADARTSQSRDAYRLLRTENRLRAEQIRGHRLAAAERREKRRRDLTESLSADWVTPYFDLFDLMGRTGDPVAGGPTNVWQRKQGKNWPIYQTEGELNLLRAPSRLLLATNSYAQGLVEGLTSYTIGPGLTYRVGKVSDSDDLPKEVVDAAQRIVDETLSRNQWFGGEQPAIEEECFGRSIEDGEFALCHYFREDGWTDYRVREPEELTCPPGADPREYGYGVLTPRNDAQRVLRYHFQWGDSPTEGEEYEPDEVTHFRRNVRRSMKRGVPDFTWDTYDALYLAGRLRTNLGDTAAQQASIVMVRQWDNGTPEELQRFAEDDSDFSQTDLLSGRQENVKYAKRGGREDIPKGMAYVNGPIANSSPIHIQVLDACLRGAGMRWQAPPWLMSGDLNAMNYATSLTAESPFVKTILRRQRAYCEAFRRAVWLALRHHVRTHGLRVLGDDRVYQWEEIERRLKLNVTAPSPETRNKLEEAQRASVEIPLGVQSRPAYMQEQGRDPDKIEADNQEYADKNGPPNAPLPTDAPPGDGTGGGGADARTEPGLPESLLESDEDGDGTFTVALLEADAPPGKVWKEVTVNRGGKQFKQKRLVNAPKAAAPKPAAKGKPQPAGKKKADPAETIAAVKAQLAGDPAKLTPAKVKAFDAQLATLTRPQLVALAKEHGTKIGRTKADAVAGIVAKAKELKKSADVRKRAAKKSPAAEPEVRAPAPAPEPPKPTAAHPAAAKIVGALNAAEGLSDEQREGYGRAVARVVRSMPQAALDRVARHLDGATFYASVKDVGPGLVEAVATQPGLTAEQSAERRKRYAYLAEEPCGGCYMSYPGGDGKNTLHLDGDQAFETTEEGRYSRGKYQAAHAIYAHEFGHAIDGPKKEITNSKEWREAYAAEIGQSDDDRAKRVTPKLSWYGGTRDSEGLAEFSRLVYGSDVPHAQIARDFPKATAVFKSRGLWPERERTGPEAKMPEVFEKRIDIPEVGSHADVLLKGGAK